MDGPKGARTQSHARHTARSNAQKRGSAAARRKRRKATKRKRKRRLCRRPKKRRPYRQHQRRRKTKKRKHQQPQLHHPHRKHQHQNQQLCRPRRRQLQNQQHRLPRRRQKLPRCQSKDPRLSPQRGTSKRPTRMVLGFSQCALFFRHLCTSTSMLNPANHSANAHRKRIEEAWASGAFKETLFPPLDQLACVDAAAAKTHLPELWQLQSSAKFACEETPESVVEVPPARAVALSNDFAAINAGGPVWGLDWCPISPDSAPETRQYLAVASHHLVSERHIVHTRTAGPNVIQLWCFEGLSWSTTNPLSEPTLALCILHENGAVWDLKWYPAGAAFGPSLRAPAGRLGLLACTFSDGTVAVYSIPLPEELRKVKRAGAGPLFVKMPPVFSTVLHRPNSHATSLSWALDSRLLLAGTSDGRAVVWDVDSSTIPVFTCVCGTTVRGVSWSPIHKGFFAASARDSSGAVQLWSIRDPFSPIEDHTPALNCLLNFFLSSISFIAHSFPPSQHCQDLAYARHSTWSSPLSTTDRL